MATFSAKFTEQTQKSAVKFTDMDEQNVAKFGEVNHVRDPSVLPDVSDEDDGKILQVKNGVWTAAELPKYDGEYRIAPSADETRALLTSQKFVCADIVVEKVPYSEVTNTSNGTTVIIL